MATASASQKISNDEMEDVRGPTDFQLAMHELKSRPPAVIALIVVFSVIILAFIPGVFSPHDPLIQNLDTHLLPPRSEVPQTLTVGSQTGTYVKGELITGNTSGAIGRLITITEPVQFVQTSKNTSFAVGENITGKSSSAVSTISAITGVKYFALGTDHLGRDILSRIIWGSRISLIVGVTAVLFSGLIGISIGIMAGFFGGWIDTLCSRTLDTLLSIPFILLAISVVAILGPSLEVIVGVIALRTWIVYARVVRGEVLALKENEFVVGARAVGCGTFRILFFYLLPNVVSSCIVIATLYLGRMIIIEASLSFLGLGVPPPTPTWGGILADGRGYIDTSWWITFFPGLVLMITVLSVNLLGDYVRDVLDPRMKRNVD